MIAFVSGKIFDIQEDNIIVNVNGIGYQVFTPINSFNDKLELNEEIFLYTYMQVREDGCTLFGFPEKQQLDIFNQLITVNGIGAKTAVLVLNTMTPNHIINAVLSGDESAFQQVSGIGKKTAGRVVLELKDKFEKVFGKNFSGLTINDVKPVQIFNSNEESAITALSQLGFSKDESKKLVAQVSGSLEDNATLEQIISAALRMANR